jgi:hypothetical protein
MMVKLFIVLRVKYVWEDCRKKDIWPYKEEMGKRLDKAA